MYLPVVDLGANTTRRNRETIRKASEHPNGLFDQTTTSKKQIKSIQNRLMTSRLQALDTSNTGFVAEADKRHEPFSTFLSPFELKERAAGMKASGSMLPRNRRLELKAPAGTSEYVSKSPKNNRQVIPFTVSKVPNDTESKRFDATAPALKATGQDNIVRETTAQTELRAVSKVKRRLDKSSARSLQASATMTTASLTPTSSSTTVVKSGSKIFDEPTETERVKRYVNGLCMYCGEKWHKNKNCPKLAAARTRKTTASAQISVVAPLPHAVQQSHLTVNFPSKQVNSDRVAH